MCLKKINSRSYIWMFSYKTLKYIFFFYMRVEHDLGSKSKKLVPPEAWTMYQARAFPINSPRIHVNYTSCWLKTFKKTYYTIFHWLEKNISMDWLYQSHILTFPALPSTMV